MHLQEAAAGCATGNCGDLGYPLYVNGKHLPGTSRIVHRPMGEYFTEPVSGLGEYFTEPLGAAPYGPLRGRSAWKLAVQLSPLAGALGQINNAKNEKAAAQANGDSAAAAVATAAVAMVVLGIVIRGGAGYFAGRAMAPTEAKKGKYAWGGALASVFFGALGLGVEGLIASR